MPEVRSPTIRRRELGAQLRSLRLNQGLTVEQVAEQLLCSPSKVSRMETGQRGATLRDVRDLCRIYGVTDEAQITHLMDLVRQSKQQAWWQSYELDFANYVGLEAAAISISYFQSSIVPGLLQTPDYIRAMYQGGYEEYTRERIEEHVEVRLRRQNLLMRDPPLQMSVVLDEAVLHRVVGGPAVMGAQLDRLVEVAQRPLVTIQIIPYTIGAHPAMDSNFNILEFGDVAPSMVYVEGLVGWMYIERAQDISRYRQVHEHLRTVALNLRESIELVMEVRALYRGLEILALALRKTCNKPFVACLAIGARAMTISQDKLLCLNWRKARRSMNNGACVEIAAADGSVAVRDSKDPNGPVLQYPSDAWASFLRKAAAGRSGEFLS